MFGIIGQKERAEYLSAFEAETMPHLDKLFRIAMWLVRDQAKAEELIQETLTRALKSFHHFENGTNCCAWLVLIMYGVKDKRGLLWSVRTKLHLVGSYEEPVVGTIAFEPRTPQEITEAEMLRALDSLPPSCQELILLIDVEDLTYKETADVLCITVSVLMRRLASARKMLRLELAGLGSTRGESGTSGGLPSLSF